MKKSKPLVFFGTEAFSAVSLRALLDNEWPIALVVTKPDFRRGRGQKLTEPLVKSIAKEHSVPVIQPDKVADASNELMAIGADFAILVAYGKIIPQAIIDIFPGGIVNLHPSLLPKYRGPAPIEAAILNGDKSTGLSLMKLSAAMDAGPVYIQDRIELRGDENQPLLYKRLAGLGANFLVNNLEGILDGQTETKSQDDSQATYTQLLTKADGKLDLSQPAEQLERQIRAFLSWPRSRVSIYGHELIVTKARLAHSQTDGDLILTCRPGYLEILELVAPSGRHMSGADFIRGYK